MIYSFLRLAFNILHQPPIRSPTTVYFTIKKEVNFIQDLLCALDLGLALAQAARATTIILSTKMTIGQICPSSAGTCTPPRVMMADAFIAPTKAILSLPPSPLQRQRRSAPRNEELHQ